MVHGTFWLRLVNTAFKALASADFFDKVEYLGSLTELFNKIPRSQLNLVREAYDYDRAENGVIWGSNHGVSPQTAPVGEL